MTLFDRLYQRLKSEQSPKRFVHSCAVSRLAGELAELHGWDKEKARLAGLLHDWAKEWRPERLVAYVKKHHVRVPDLDFILRVSPNLLHAYVGADYVQRQGWIKDADVLKAIQAHTFGAPKMNLPERILYVADLAAYDRQFPGTAVIRKQARENLQKALAMSVEIKLSEQLRKRKAIHPLALRLWNKGICGL